MLDPLMGFHMHSIGFTHGKGLGAKWREEEKTPCLEERARTQASCEHLYSLQQTPSVFLDRSRRIKMVRAKGVLMFSTKADCLETEPAA